MAAFGRPVELQEVANISSVCVLCSCNIGGSFKRGRRCLSTSVSLVDSLRKIDKAFVQSLEAFVSAKKDLFICASCTTKLNKFDNLSLQLEKAQERLSDAFNTIKHGLSVFSRNYLPAKKHHACSWPSPRSRRALTPVQTSLAPIYRVGLHQGQGRRQAEAQHGCKSPIKTPRKSSKIPRRVGFSPFDPDKAGRSPAPSTPKRKTPTVSYGQIQEKENIGEEIHPISKRLFSPMDIEGNTFMESCLSVRPKSVYHHNFHGDVQCHGKYNCRTDLILLDDVQFIHIHILYVEFNNATCICSKEVCCVYQTSAQYAQAYAVEAGMEDLAMPLTGTKRTLVQKHSAGAPKAKTSKMIHFGARITVKYGNVEKTRVLEGGAFVSMCKGVVQGGRQGDIQVVNALFEKTSIRNSFTEKLLKVLGSQCKGLCSITNPSILRDTSPRHLNCLDMEGILREWQTRAELLYRVLAVIMGLECDITTPIKLSRKHLYALVLAGSTLLFRRSPKMSLVQHAIGLLLDFGGTRDATVSALSNCGLSVSTSTIHEKRKQIEQYHDSQIRYKLFDQKEAAAVAAVSSVPCLPLPVYDIQTGNISVIRHLLHLGLFSTDPQQCPPFVNWDIYGDNLDFTIHSFRQTMDKRNQSIHWFALVGAPLRVKPLPTASRVRPRRDVTSVANWEFLPHREDHATLKENFVFHIMEVITRFIPFLLALKEVVPKYLDHPYAEEMAKKSEYVLLDVLEKSENSNDEMIDIMNHIHDHYVPYVPNAAGENTIEKVVFGGDQLTNERAYSAQLNMANGTNSASRLMGVHHRTEGLHLCMNTCLYILQTFYSSGSLRDIGTLYHLKTLVDRRNLQFDMTTGYNQARNFVDDVLDSHIIAGALMYFGMESLDSEPKENLPPENLEGLTDAQKLNFLRQVSSAVLDNIYRREKIDHTEELRKVEDNAVSRNQQGRYSCHVTGCCKSFASLGWLKQHLTKKHNITIQASAPKTSEPPEQFDGVFNYASTFTRLALLFRDTRDAYKMGDGDRLFRNFRFLMLHFDQSTHVKYRLWLWRMLAYDLAILSEYERHSYRWNMSVNVTGGMRHCIANDNLVEIHVHRLKDLMRSMGANISYQAVRRAAKCLGTVKSVREELGSYASGKHADYTEHRIRDIKEMSACLVKNQNICHLPTREHINFPNMSGDLLSGIDLLKLNEWLETQKLRASREMQFPY